MNDIPEAALRTIEDTFGTRFVPHAADEAEPHAEQPFASVFPESAKEVKSLMKLAEHHSIPLVARGAGTAPYSGKVPRALVVRFDGMRDIRLPEESGEDWVEIEGQHGILCAGPARDEARRWGRTCGSGLPRRGGPRECRPGPLPRRGAALAPRLPKRRHGSRREPRGRARAYRRLPAGEGILGRACPQEGERILSGARR